MRTPLALLILCPLAACTDPNDILVDLAPDVVSSIDGTLSVRAIVLSDRDPVSDEPITISVQYKDRNGADHMIQPLEGKTNEAGAFEGTLSGLTWDGTGTVTAAVGSTLTGAATFSVLDRTPPVVTITPPANNQVRIGMDTQISINAKDEIGISQVFFDSSAGNRNRTTTIASGATDTTTTFTLRVENVSAGASVMLFALASDLSGNQAAAKPITVTAVP